MRQKTDFRHQLEGELVYHIYNRGNRKLDIFHSLDDYNYFKHLLKKYSEKKNLAIYHYCIMPNHYHLLFEIKEPERLASVMAGIDKAYSIYYHWKYRTAGYLWQGRYRSKPIQKDGYLINCGRYIEMNPVKSQLALKAEEYPHSSAGYYVLGKKDTIVSEDIMYQNFGNNFSKRKEAYSKFLMSFEEDGDRDEYEKFNKPIGDQRFINKLYKEKGRYQPRRRGRPIQV